MPAELMSPQFQIYNTVYAISLARGYDTFDYLPANKVAYPFVFIGEQSDQDRITKTSVYGNVQQTIHIYGTARQRKQVTTMIDHIRHDCRMLTKTTNFSVTLRNANGQIINDNSTAEPLLHGILELEFQFN